MEVEGKDLLICLASRNGSFVINPIRRNVIPLLTNLISQYPLSPIMNQNN
jgi:hypothetical protein